MRDSLSTRAWIMHTGPGRPVLAYMVLGILILMPDFSFAQGAGTPMGNVLCTAAGWFTGNSGKGLATLAVLIVGVWKLLGKISGKMAVIAAVGVAVLFNAGNIITSMNAGAPLGC
jgi:type IV secretory pathway VirB2 component (pilin)